MKTQKIEKDLVDFFKGKADEETQKKIDEMWSEHLASREAVPTTKEFIIQVIEELFAEK